MALLTRLLLIKNRQDRISSYGSLFEKLTIMQKRILGKSVLEVSALGLGCMGLSFGYGPLENNGADDVKFTAEELGQFNTELAKIKVKGERLPQFVLQFSNVEAPPPK
jgi:hypothetical protein